MLLCVWYLRILLYFGFIICKRIKSLKFINVYLMVLLLSIACIYFSKYRKYSIKLIFAASLQGTVYVKVPGREMSEFLSEFTVTFIRIEVMPVLGQ